jgi:hypothetical protein
MLVQLDKVAGGIPAEPLLMVLIATGILVPGTLAKLVAVG